MTDAPVTPIAPSAPPRTVTLNDEETRQAEKIARHLDETNRALGTAAADYVALKSAIAESEERLLALEKALAARVAQRNVYLNDVQVLATQIALRNKIPLNQETWWLNVFTQDFTRQD